MAVSTSQEIRSEFVNIGISLGYGSLTSFDDGSIRFAWKYLFQNTTDTEDVVADVCPLGYNLFWRDVARGAGRLFEDGKVIGILKSEIYELYMIAVMGNHDIGRLKVSVYYLLGMDVVYGIK